LLYEGRKDAISYGIFLAFFWLGQDPPVPIALAADVPPARIDFKVDGRTLSFAPDEIFWLEAAGNYVTLHLADREILVRSPLSSLEQRLRPFAFERIHRSRLINNNHIREQQTRPSGEIRFTLSDGRMLMGSRRRGHVAG
jgi:DNA-binding LytR/AlgR family response regulator